MKVGKNTHLTYCSNIHPGESWAEIKDALARHLPKIKKEVSPTTPFGIGLRLSAKAALSLEDPNEMKDFKLFLHSEGLYVFTLNGFPYGSFHRTEVKDQVYLPNWTSASRLDYSNRLANILIILLPSGISGSISTVPGGYLPHLTVRDDYEKITHHLIQHIAHLHKLYKNTGKYISLALEPEPGCLLDNTESIITFFADYLYNPKAVSLLGEFIGLDAEASLATLKTHLGICLDVCHLAITFEDPIKAISRIQQAGIALHKIQLSSALKIMKPSVKQKKELRSFAEDVYLHQVAAKRGESMYYWADLVDALADKKKYDEWRIHFHVPLWVEKIDSFVTTIDTVTQVLKMHKTTPLSPHLEVETYTWGVLEAKYKKYSLTTSITKEIAWVLSKLA